MLHLYQCCRTNLRQSNGRSQLDMRRQHVRCQKRRIDRSAMLIIRYPSSSKGSKKARRTLSENFNAYSGTDSLDMVVLIFHVSFLSTRMTSVTHSYTARPVGMPTSFRPRSASLDEPCSPSAPTSTSAKSVSPEANVTSRSSTSISLTLALYRTSTPCAVAASYRMS